MEPVYYIEVQAPADCVPAVYAVLARRRGTRVLFMMMINAFVWSMGLEIDVFFIFLSGH